MQWVLQDISLGCNLQTIRMSRNIKASDLKAAPFSIAKMDKKQEKGEGARNGTFP